MKSSIINIGNSQGIILPAALLRQLKLSVKSGVEIKLVDGVIIIKPDARRGWAEAAKEMGSSGDDELLMDDFPNEFDDQEWTW